MLEIKKEGQRTEVYRDNELEAFVVKTPTGFIWESKIADPPNNRGEAETVAIALITMGYKIKRQA